MDTELNPIPLSVDPQLSPLTPNHISPLPTRTNKPLIIIGITTFVVAILAVVIYFYGRSIQSTATKSETYEDTTEQLSPYEAALHQITSVVTGQPSSPSVSPAPSPSISTVDSSFDQIISTGDYKEKQVDHKQNDGAVLENTNLKIKLPSTKQSFSWIPQVLAAELQPLYPLYLQNPELTSFNNMARKLNIRAEATNPESNKILHLEYRDPEAKLTYDPTAGFGKLLYDAKPAEGSLPSKEEAIKLSSELLQSLDISLTGLTASAVTSSLASEYENFAKLYPAIAVNYYLSKDGHSVVFADKSLFTNSSDDPSSPQITVVYTGNSKLTRIFHGTYGQSVSTTPINLNNRSLDAAVEELKTYGGHLRSIVELEGQRTNFACAKNQCSVHDAVINKAELGYYWNNSLPGLRYDEVNDSKPRAFEYLVPVWIFEGTGLMDKSLTDQNGKLVEKVDSSNRDQYYSQPVRFTATIPAFTQTNEVNLLNVKDYSLTKLDNNQAKVSFSSAYQFSAINMATFSQAEPRNGIKYRLLILFPDQTYTIINGYKDEIYPGEVTFNLGQSKGAITTYLEFSDFSNLIEKRTLQLE